MVRGNDQDYLYDEIREELILSWMKLPNIPFTLKNKK